MRGKVLMKIKWKRRFFWINFFNFEILIKFEISFYPLIIFNLLKMFAHHLINFKLKSNHRVNFIKFFPGFRNWTVELHHLLTHIFPIRREINFFKVFTAKLSRISSSLEDCQVKSSYAPSTDMIPPDNLFWYCKSQHKESKWA
jgi:hypothetical protein